MRDPSVFLKGTQNSTTRSCLLSYALYNHTWNFEISSVNVQHYSVMMILAFYEHPKSCPQSVVLGKVWFGIPPKTRLWTTNEWEAGTLTGLIMPQYKSLKLTMILWLQLVDPTSLSVKTPPLQDEDTKEHGTFSISMSTVGHKAKETLLECNYKTSLSTILNVGIVV